MKVLFAVSNEEISESIVKKYQKEYKQIISYKNVYYFNAIIKELQKDKTYDRIVISEDLEAFTHTQYDQIDKFIFEKLDNISDEASNIKGNDTPIILICSDRRTKSEPILVKLFGIGVYNAIIGNDRSVDEVCRLINRPRVKKEAKSYYKIDVEEVNYQAENENDVSEMEIQNIVAHYKRLGKNEERYIDSFNNIAAQYNDAQLRIITKFLPLNVRAVLEEKSQKYQQIMSFNNSLSDTIRVKKKEEDGPSQILLKSKNKETILSKPVVIPSSVNMSGTKKLAKKKAEPVVEEKPEQAIVSPVEEEYNEEVIENNNEVEMGQPVKRGRGRPRKAVPQEILSQEQTGAKRGRGRPRKNVVPEQQNEETILPNVNYKEQEETVLPGLNYEEQEENILPGLNSEGPKETMSSGLNYEEEETTLPGLNYEEEETTLPGLNYEEEETTLLGLNVEEQEETMISGINYEKQEPNTVAYGMNKVAMPQINRQAEERQNQEFENERIDLSNLLTPDKKIITFVGTSKNGTSFIVNNLAELMSSIGINTVILDTTRNRNSYYIYTKNEEMLRETAANSIEGLVHGIAKGVEVHKNLTIYTSLPNENEDIYHVNKILETLLKNYSLILIDTDFDTPFEYFKQSQETYLVQTMDILTIQPLTAFLRELKAKNILDEKKLKIVLNKAVRIRGIRDETIIGGMAFYNDPAMSFMTELFDRDRIKYVSIPFEEETYVKYLEGVIECDISLKGYSKGFMQSLKELGNMIYPIVTTPQIKNKKTYQPPSYSNGGDNFSSSMNDTLNKMKRNF